ncbi:MAG: L-lysine exporter family protein LysE/ArgO [Bacteriovoracaceae bacterium]
MKYFSDGLFLQASLILALGAQNIFVLESGLKKRSPFTVAAICSFCDFVLIMLGVLGASSLFLHFPYLKIGFGVIGVGFLFFYGLKKLKEGIRPLKLEESKVQTTTSIKKVISLSLAFSLLNPHVYLDTLVLIGSYAAKFPVIKNRISFGLGASFFSIIWFFSLAFFSSSMNQLLNNPKSMRVVSFVSGLILLVLTWKLGVDQLNWISKIL